ncbi:MAG TPA: DMT family transporter [Albitalea sp.]|uniref:DMT family transporter n=1 Tax=Piscinibacter sp. TaxID=1903157 RepID=UPI002ED275FB
MRLTDWIRLTVLGAVWGASFIFMRVLAPVLGPVFTTEVRVATGGLTLLLYFLIIRFNPRWNEHWRHYLIIGAFNVALPFILFSFAAQHVPASYSAIINSMTPLFGTLFSAVWLGEVLTKSKLTGLALGIAGVVIIGKGAEGVLPTPQLLVSILACLAAAASYAGAGIYIKRFATGVNPLGSAGCAQLVAAVALLPFCLVAQPAVVMTWTIVLNVAGIGILSSALGFVLYFRLVKDVGPSRAMMVAFLTPLFGLLWGTMFLGEPLTAPTVIGCAMIIGAIGLIVRPSPMSQPATDGVVGR